VLFLLIPAVPLFRAVVPIEQTLVLLVPALAACAVTGWWSGGRTVVAVIWLALAAWLLVGATTGGVAYANMARGWSLLLAASFGSVCVLRPGQPFLPRALAACGITLGVALLVLLLTPGSAARVDATMGGEFTRRVNDALQSWSTLQESAEWTSFAESNPDAARLAEQGQAQLQQVPAAARTIFPAMLMLESLVALGLAWSLYHRITRTRIGPPLSRLRQFRFNDQLVWGAVAAVVILVLPTLAPLRPVGLNLLLFFGVLYALRGLGVLAWFFAPGRLMMVVVIGFAILMWPVLSVFALGVGLGDTWLDWRNRARPTT
jgi:hypothetical protein